MRNKIGMEPLPFSPAWLRQKFQETGKRPADLVEHLRARGIPMDATKLSKSMSDSRTRRIQPDERYPIWDFFGLDLDDFAPWNVGQSLPPAVLDAARVLENRDRPMPNAGLPERVRFDHSTLPILGKSLGSQANARVLFNGQPLGSVERPQRLANVPNAYATYVHGTSMEPRYEAGEIVLVNPEKPVRKDNYVVAQIYDNDGDPPYGYIKKFVSFSGKELVLLQLNPPEGEDEIMRFPKDRVLSVHRIVGTLDE